jgi:hypothetical protein
MYRFRNMNRRRSRCRCRNMNRRWSRSSRRSTIVLRFFFREWRNKLWSLVLLVFHIDRTRRGHGTIWGDSWFYYGILSFRQDGRFVGILHGDGHFKRLQRSFSVSSSDWRNAKLLPARIIARTNPWFAPFSVPESPFHFSSPTARVTGIADIRDCRINQGINPTKTN